MNRLNKKFILNSPLEYLPMAQEFIDQTKRMGFNCLKEIFKIKQIELEINPHFTNEWMIDFCELGEEYDFLWQIENENRF